MRASEMSKLMKKYEKQERAKKKKLLEEEQKQPEPAPGPSIPLGKTTRLVFFKQYNTYQALLEVYPKNDLPAGDAFAKVILYIMRWFRNRLGAEIFEDLPEIAFLREDYPEPESYHGFDIEKVSNINGLEFIDFETAYMPDKKGWVVSLIEPDNGLEGKDIQGRTFTTEIAVYRREASVVLGIREGCREPRTNEEDASGFRPGFVRDIFHDKDLLIGEQGLDSVYAFGKAPFMLNGKSDEACRNLFEDLIASPNRQMPVLFVPETYYEDNKEEVDKKTEGLLGYCHIVVWTGSCNKLFMNVMENDEFVEVAKEGQLIFYRTTKNQIYPSDYYEPDTENLMDSAKARAMHEPLRKFFDFKGFSFKPSWWEGVQASGEDRSEETEELRNRYEAELAQSKREVNALQRDNDELQRKIDSLTAENKKLDGIIAKDMSQIRRQSLELEASASECESIRSKLKEQNALLMQRDMTIKGMQRSESERYIPMINLPLSGLDKKADILKWISDYYSDVLVIHDNARRSFIGENRNIDWHRFCMMIHFIAGYTRHRNEGGADLDAREYDPEGANYSIERSGSGQGALSMHKDKYTISINEGGKTKSVLMDLHIKYGKGGDANMIRIYFYYSSDEKKSIIGFMPGHLPTKKDPH